MIAVNEPIIAKNAIEYVTDCLKTGWVSSAGKYISLFEEKFAQFLGVKYATTTTSGTTALQLAFLSLGIGVGDEVILPTLTMIACPYSIIYTGAKPVVVDSENDTGNIDVDLIEAKITKRTKAIMVVHLYGHPVDMDKVIRVAKKHNLYVVEDAAEAHGATYKGQKVGSLGDVGCFSFYGNKIVTTGEGGMVVTNNKDIIDRGKQLKDLAHSPSRRFLHEEIGYNFRMTNMQAALGLAQLEKIDKFLETKKEMAYLYNKSLSGIKGLTLPVEKEYAKNVYWMYSIMVEKEFGLTRDELMLRLKEKGVDTRSYFIPVHKQPALTKRGLFVNEVYPVAEELSEKGLYLPSGLAITNKQIEEVCTKVKDILNEN